MFHNQRMATNPELIQSGGGQHLDYLPVEEPLSVIQKEYKLLFELLNCTGVEFEWSYGNRIQASEQWWVNKIQENYKYAKFKDRNCGEIYKTYSGLFGNTYNCSQFSFTPTKMSQRGLGLGPESYKKLEYDKLRIKAKSTDSNNGPTKAAGNCSMDISKQKSGDKHKWKQPKEKSKKKKFGAREVTATLDQISSIDNNHESWS